MHNFVENNQLQFASSGLMRLPSKIVKHVSDAAGVPVSASYKIKKKVVRSGQETKITPVPCYCTM